MVGYIYLITDTTNGMKYTGKHHYHIEGQLDPNYHGSGVIIKNIYKKRPETLKEEYIKTCYSEEEMCSDEQHYIEVFDTLWPHGYNLTKGGDGLIPCEETRRKMSEARKGKPAHNKGKPAYNKGIPMSEETKKKLSDAHKGLKSGEKHPMFGKHHSDETKKKMSKIVLQFTLDGVFIREWPSTRECGRNGFNQGQVAACCRGEKPQYKGFKWCYA